MRVLMGESIQWRAIFFLSHFHRWRLSFFITSNRKCWLGNFYFFRGIFHPCDENVSKRKRGGMGGQSCRTPRSGGEPQKNARRTVGFRYRKRRSFRSRSAELQRQRERERWCQSIRAVWETQATPVPAKDPVAASLSLSVSHPLSASCIASHSCLFFLFELLFTVAIRSSFCSASITIVAVAVWPLLTIKIGGVRVQPSGFAILPLRRRSSIHWLSPDWPSLRRKFVYIRLVFHTGLYLLSPTVNRRSPNKHTWSRISILFVRATWPADRRACSASCRPIFVIISWTLAGEPRFGLNRLFVLFCLFFLHCFGKTTIWRTDQHTMYSRFFSIISRRGVRLLGFSPFFAFFSACLQSWLSVTLRLDDCPFHPGFFSVSFFMLHFYYFQAIEWQSVTIDKPESGIFFYYFHLVRAAWSSVGQQAMTKPNKNDFHIWISAYPLELTGSSDTPAFRWNNSYINKRRKRSLLFFFLLGGEGGGQRTWTPL